DGNGEFTQGLGLLVDKRNLGFGQRSWRYSMLVKDGVIVKQFVEPQKDGDPFEVSDAETMLRYLDENVQLPHDVLMISRPGCSFCDHAKAMLQSRGIEFDEVSANPRRLKAVSGKTTTPQVFIDGEYVGGAAELETWLAQHK
ncbi:MAG: glutaredoxin domain-containing protein, partial [Polyangiaceae bacterium]